MAEYRREVGEAVAANLDEFESAGNQSEERDTARFVALIELGVRLGLEAAAVKGCHYCAQKEPMRQDEFGTYWHSTDGFYRRSPCTAQAIRMVDPPPC